MIWHSGIPDPHWDDALFAADGHFVQSSHWAAFNQALGRQTFYAQGDGWQCLAILEPARLGNRLYCPYGPTATTKKAMAEALHALRQLARGHGAMFVRAEPISPLTGQQLANTGLKPALKDIQPRQTWVLDLTRPQDELLAHMTATNRNLYRNYANKGLSLHDSRNPADMPIFINMMREVAKHNAITQHSDNYYQTMADTLLPRKAATLYIAQHDGQPVASAFVFDSPVTRYYAHAAARYEARKLHPGTPLLAHMIFEAKNHGQRVFDFVGVAPKDAPPDHRWAGFTRFKQSFGGEYKQYAGTWELPASPLYILYRGTYKMHKQLRGK